MNFATLSSLAEIYQFLGLFILLSIKNTPSELYQFFASKSLFNFNFISIENIIPYINCKEMKEAEHFGGTYENHPAVNCVLIFCNIFPSILFLSALISMGIISRILFSRLHFNVIKLLLWKGFISILFSDFINIFLICLIQLIYVNLI